jgi:tripartite-type tricarboxylate transporter receptor subunit TctC
MSVRIVRLLAALALATTALGALAQAYPSKPIRFVVPYPPGGPTDILGRAVAQALTQSLGQPVVVENKPGASGMIGAEQVAKAAPDGYTLLVNASIHVINPSLFSKTTFDAMHDFAPVTQIASVPLILVVGQPVQANSVKELIALAKANPGKLTFASSSVGAAPHLAGELLKRMAGIDIVHVPYKGSGPATTDLIGGHVTMMIDSMPSSIGHVKSGKLKVLGVSTARRTPALPDTPTIAETVPGFDIATWYGVWAPAKTPKEIVNKVSSEIAKSLKRADLSERLAGLGAEGVGSTPAEFAAYCESEFRRWAKVVKDSGAKLD